MQLSGFNVGIKYTIVIKIARSMKICPQNKSGGEGILTFSDSGNPD